MKLSDDEDYDDDFYDDEYDDDFEDENRKRAFSKKIIRAITMMIMMMKISIEEDFDLPEKSTKLGCIQAIKLLRCVSLTRRSNVNMEVCVIKPNSVEDAREITETLLSGRTVILNLEGLDLEVAQRIIDFTSGVCVCNQR